MAIVINGSGTITGVSAGGLPDDSITTADIADSAVTDAKITAVTSSKLSGNLPALNASALTNLAAANITGTLPAIDGSALTGISAGLTASAYNANSNGYITLSNGLIIQWARQGSLANGGIRSIIFPITFPNALFSFASSWTVQTSGSWHSAFPDGSMSTSGFGAHNVSGSTQGVVYVATGR
tara:strand:- start:284 stop:829 length:546 start_codon:yes stop_codon:yes gene_type:complete